MSIVELSIGLGYMEFADMDKNSFNQVVVAQDRFEWKEA